MYPVLFLSGQITTSGLAKGTAAGVRDSKREKRSCFTAQAGHLVLLLWYNVYLCDYCLFAVGRYCHQSASEVWTAANYRSGWRTLRFSVE